MRGHYHATHLRAPPTRRAAARGRRACATRPARTSERPDSRVAPVRWHESAWTCSTPAPPSSSRSPPCSSHVARPRLHPRRLLRRPIRARTRRSSTRARWIRSRAPNSTRLAAPCSSTRRSARCRRVPWCTHDRAHVPRGPPDHDLRAPRRIRGAAGRDRRHGACPRRAVATRQDGVLIARCCSGWRRRCGQDVLGEGPSPW